MKFGLAFCKVVFGAFALFQPGFARGDSPLTSADFHSHYATLPAVQAARSGRTVTGPVADFLLGRAPNHQKAAVVNGLGWKFRGQKNGELFALALAKRKGVILNRLRYRHFNPSQLFVLGYLLAMDDYFKMKPLRPGAKGVLGATALDLLGRAARRLRRDFAVQFIYALVRAQQVMDKSFCKVYLTMQKVLKKFPPKKRKMKPGAVASVTGYIHVYRSYCIHLRPKFDHRYNMVYNVISYGKWIVTGSQAGVTVFDRATGRIHALKRQFISNTLIVHGKYLWIGAYDRVLRYDGRTFKEYLVRKTARGVKVYRGTGAVLMARQGRNLYRYDGANDRFVAAGVLGASAYHIIHRRNGEVWRLRFMNALHCSGCGSSNLYIPVRSPRYPGRDPRRFYEDPAGRLWVTDFDNGFFYWEAKRQRFVRLPGVAAKASDLVVDVAKQRTWLLHYTRGLYLSVPGKPMRFFDLSSLRYMRKLYLDGKGFLWVAGWNQLIRVRLVGGKLQKKSFVVRPPKRASPPAKPTGP